MKTLSTRRDFKGPAWFYKVQDYNGVWHSDYCGRKRSSCILDDLSLLNPGLELNVEIKRMEKNWAELYKELCYG